MTDIHSGEWTHVRGRKTMGMSEKEISKFLASKALKDARLVRELEVAPKKTIPYRKSCHLVGHSKKDCQQKQPRMKMLKKIAKVKKSNKIIEPTMKQVEVELQKGITELRKSENSLCRISKELGSKVMKSKRLIEIQ
jgi:hypothetical protein